ncbi:MAG: hypothetical protein K2L34_13470 [Muribaculaceae bacterium]|nr:hypothetical protein [Muribaculaceae bacterium]
MILQSDPAKFLGKGHKLRIPPVDVLHAVAQCVAYVKMMVYAGILETAHKIVRTVGYSVFRGTSGFLGGFFHGFLDITPFEAFSDVHSQYGDIVMTQRVAGIFGWNTQYHKKFLLIDHDALVDHMGIFALLWHILLIN